MMNLDHTADNDERDWVHNGQHLVNVFDTWSSRYVLIRLSVLELDASLPSEQKRRGSKGQRQCNVMAFWEGSFHWLQLRASNAL